MLRALGISLLSFVLICQATAQQAAGQAGFVPASRGAERTSVDPQDPIERFALLTTGGPVIVQVSLTIDGQPFRIGREKLLEEMIAAADTDKDGRPTWSEALATSRFTFGRLGNIPISARQSILRSVDKNGNDLVEIPEARQFLAQYSQGATFTLSGGPSNLRVVGGVLQPMVDAKPDILKLLDTDLSKSLDAKELAAAAERLKSRDADDNDVLEAAEVTGTPAASNVRVAAVSSTSRTAANNALLLGPTASQSNVQAALVQKYKKNARGKLSADRFPLFPQLFTALDKDESGEIEPSEVLGLNEIPPHIELAVDLAGQKAGSGLKIIALSAELHSAADERGSKVIELPGVRISLASSTIRRVTSYDGIAKSLLMQFDKDGNGYLDKTELPNLPGQFELYDENGDGKAFPDEIAAGYARQAAPQMTQVVVNIVEQNNSLFQTLDANGDGRLGLREMRAAATRLAALDTDQDQIIGGDEIPESISVSFTLGGTTGVPVDRPGGFPTYGPRVPTSGGPEWFTRMDRNGDGDVTLKEFLGSEADFARLDTSGDGLLDPQEARAAAK